MTPVLNALAENNLRKLRPSDMCPPYLGAPLWWDSSGSHIPTNQLIPPDLFRCNRKKQQMALEVSCADGHTCFAPADSWTTGEELAAYVLESESRIRLSSSVSYSHVSVYCGDEIFYLPLWVTVSYRKKSSFKIMIAGRPILHFIPQTAILNYIICSHDIDVTTVRSLVIFPRL